MIIIIKNDNNYEILMVCFSDAWCCCNVQSNLMVKTTRQTAKSQPTWQCLLSLVVMNWQLAVLSLCQKSFLAVTLIQLFVLQLAPLHNCLHQLPSLRINTSVKLMSQGRSRHREYDRLDVINVSTVWQLTAANVTRVGQCIFTHFWPSRVDFDSIWSKTYSFYGVIAESELLFDLFGKFHNSSCYI